MRNSPVTYLSLISSLIALRSEHIFCAGSTFLFVKIFFWLFLDYNIVLVNIPSAFRDLEKCVFFCWIEYPINLKEIKFIYSIVLVVYIFTDFFLLDLSIIDKGSWKSPTTIVNLSISLLVISVLPPIFDIF